MEFYSDRKNEILSFANKWLQLENSILSEVRLRREKKSHILSHMQIIDPKQM
jgi:hypothetical protein